MNNRHVNIIYWQGGYGLQKDANIIAKVLEANRFLVTITPYQSPELKQFRYLRLVERLLVKFLRLDTIWPFSLLYPRPESIPYDINLFLEQVELKWLTKARVNCLIPNQEWFEQHSLSLLPLLDLVLCKTHHAETIFQRFGCPTEFISFSSHDCFHPSTVSDKLQCLHVAGRSPLKGTGALTAVWASHPEWPTLIVIARCKTLLQHFPLPSADNIVYIDQFLDDKSLREYQNSCQFHLYPSKSEGFGHVIVEAMSCAGLVLTTNAPPMNELISPDRGLLVNYQEMQPMRLGHAYEVDRQSLEMTIKQALAMDPQSFQRLGQNARAWYLANDQFFQNRLVSILHTL